MPSEKRKVGNVYFYLYDRGPNIFKAKSKANELRKKGRKVRLIREGKGMYAIYTRP